MPPIIAAAADDLVAPAHEVPEQPRVLRVPLDERVLGIVVVAPARGPVLAEVIQAHHLVPGREQLGNEIPADEARRAGDKDPHQTWIPLPVAPQISTIGRSPVSRSA